MVARRQSCRVMLSTGLFKGLAGHIFDGEVGIENNVASPIFSVQLKDGALQNFWGGGEACYSIHVSDGTNHQCLSSRMTWSAVNTSGTISADVASSGTDDSTTAPVGTLVTIGLNNGWSIDISGDVATFKLQVASSLTPTEMHVHLVLVNNHCSRVTLP